MGPSEIRERILEDHERLRVLLDELDGLSKRFAAGEEVGLELRDHGVGLFEVFAAHLALEDSRLVPALAGLVGGGPDLADRLAREHAEQRAMLRYLIGRLEAAQRPTSVVAHEVCRFAAEVRADMLHEERTILSAGLLTERS
jgi:hemerythrin-like domain-containing protein